MGNPSQVLSALMCAPTHYAVRYRINPWMEPGRAVDAHRCARQWRALVSGLREEGVQIQLIEQDPCQPDMVFTANAGLVHGRTVVLSRFAHPERHGEQARFARWFEEEGFEVMRMTEPFEGAGDAFVFNGRLLAGWGWRSTHAGVVQAASKLGLPCLALQLVDPRFYHLDTCLSILDSDTILWYPAAFSEESQRSLRSLDAVLIPTTEREALGFACNAVTSGRQVFTTGGTGQLRRALASAGFELREVALDEFLKAGGGARCLTLPLESATQTSPG